MALDYTLARGTITIASCLALLACDTAPAPVAPHGIADDASALHASHIALGPEFNQQLAALRELTAPFRDFDRAKAAGWSTPITPCLASPSGAMGIHYGNVAFIDGNVNLLEPELLMYEPEADGRLRFVGVEYIVPLAAWTGATPPMLLGQEFQVNATFGVWALHVWLGRENPSGIFTNWNPKVSCAAAS
jgi:hypothetical protein